jgi:SAM-dependent methyltransferase
MTLCRHRSGENDFRVVQCTANAIPKQVRLTAMFSPENVYDRVLYPTAAFPQTHPDRLAVIGTLLGMNPRDVEHCRVLELGCGDGGNLVPMAYGLPGSQFVGVDLAAKPVSIAQERVKRAGLTSIRVQQMDLMELGSDFGVFDYIIAHGLYAWVPEPVQEKVLAICRANLAPNGIAFVSYNTNPAGQIRQILREIIAFQETRVPASGNRVLQARDTIARILQVAMPGSHWKALLEDEFRRNFGRDDEFVYHDDLTSSFLPLSFHAFVERAARSGLQYMSDADMGDLADEEMSDEAQAALESLADGNFVAYQQYLDFARCRQFRRSLLCHAEITLRRQGILESLKKVLVASPLRVSGNQLDGTVEFSDFRTGGTIKTDNRALIAAIRHLEAIWPHAERFENLQNAILGSAPIEQRPELSFDLAKAFLRLADAHLVDCRSYHFPLAAAVSEMPTASLLARLMVNDSGLITTQFHTNVKFEDSASRKLLILLDGTRDRSALAATLLTGSEKEISEERLRNIEGYLETLYRMGLLVA